VGRYMNFPQTSVHSYLLYNVLFGGLPPILTSPSPVRRLGISLGFGIVVSPPLDAADLLGRGGVQLRWLGCLDTRSRYPAQL
jgi:hypothetical protein